MLRGTHFNGNGGIDYANQCEYVTIFGDGMVDLGAESTRVDNLTLKNMSKI